ncbi:HAD family hydrolase [Myxococcus stipitatus]|uniref:NIF family HAD-type phosphatase n=1 Tax=Myxococcus stipitatus TaxID=83455 RepID=UPI001F2953C3|nr:HAD family hydrolase [Myxococcus stipitatus]MCE9669778.1 HAD family hydrolase [Myxococcus stipitatus]
MNTSERMLLILDLDETLIHATPKPLSRPADFRVFEYQVYRRPQLERFLAACAARFQLAIWSSADDQYVAQVVQHIIPRDLPLAFVWGRSRSTFSVDHHKVMEDGYLDPSSHYNYAKKLEKVKRRGYRLERMLIVDDTPAKCRHNYGNAIYVREYLGQEDDVELSLLAAYLERLADVPNVRTLEKRHWRSQVTSPR